MVEGGLHQAGIVLHELLLLDDQLVLGDLHDVLHDVAVHLGGLSLAGDCSAVFMNNTQLVDVEGVHLPNLDLVLVPERVHVLPVEGGVQALLGADGDGQLRSGILGQLYVRESPTVIAGSCSDETAGVATEDLVFPRGHDSHGLDFRFYNIVLAAGGRKVNLDEVVRVAAVVVVDADGRVTGRLSQSRNVE